MLTLVDFPKLNIAFPRISDSEYNLMLRNHCPDLNTSEHKELYQKHKVLCDKLLEEAEWIFGCKLENYHAKYLAVIGLFMEDPIQKRYTHVEIRDEFLKIPQFDKDLTEYANRALEELK